MQTKPCCDRRRKSLDTEGRGGSSWNTEIRRNGSPARPLTHHTTAPRSYSGTGSSSQSLIAGQMLDQKPPHSGRSVRLAGSSMGLAGCNVFWSLTGATASVRRDLSSFSANRSLDWLPLDSSCFGSFLTAVGGREPAGVWRCAGARMQRRIPVGGGDASVVRVFDQRILGDHGVALGQAWQIRNFEKYGCYPRLA
jgi:hypothetical protein